MVSSLCSRLISTIRGSFFFLTFLPYLFVCSRHHTFPKVEGRTQVWERVTGSEWRETRVFESFPRGRYLDGMYSFLIIPCVLYGVTLNPFCRLATSQATTKWHLRADLGMRSASSHFILSFAFSDNNNWRKFFLASGSYFLSQIYKPMRTLKILKMMQNQRLKTQPLILFELPSLSPRFFFPYHISLININPDVRGIVIG